MKKLLLFLAVFMSAKSYAQHTGYYDTTITFMGQPREVVFYVPAAYNGAIANNLMVMLHGLGDPVDDFAGAMTGPSPDYWDIQDYVPNTIFVFPEVANLDNDYYSPTGAEQIVQTCIDIARSTYNIDTTNMVLEGFSIGGRDALRYGLANYTEFKGILLNTPAVQTIPEALNQTSFSFEYNNASKIPLYITHGLDDTQWEPNVDTVVKELILNNGIVRYFEIPDMGHSVPPFPLMNFLSFFDTATTTPGPNLDIAYVTVPDNTCNAQIPSSCIVRNVGKDTIKSFKFDYSLNGNTQTYSWNGLMASFQHVAITLPILSASTTLGIQFVNINEDSVNSNTPEDISFFTNEVYNITDSGTVFVQPTNTSLPISTGFETGLPGDWFNPLNHESYNWLDVNDTAFGTATPVGYNSSQWAMLAQLFNMTNGEQNYLIMPSVDFTQSTDTLNYTLDFYESYAQQTASDNDKLEIVYSTDCGSTWTSVWNQYGTSLATVSPEAIDYNNSTGIFSPSSNAQWKEETVNLNSVPSQNAIIAFRATCEGGNTMFLDNVNMNGEPLGIQEVYSSDYKLYPNPATDQVNIAAGSDDPIAQVNVTNVLGNKILTINNSGQNNILSVNTASFADGIYFFQVVTKNGIQTNKVLISK